MSLHTALANDWRVLDDPYTVQLEFPRRPIKDPTALTNPPTNDVVEVKAFPQQLTWREKLATGGTYLSARRVWLLPDELLPREDGSRRKIQQGCVIIEADGSRWTVQEEASRQVFDTLWRLDTLNLSLAHDLRDSISIERATIIPDSAGVPVKTFPPAGWNLTKQGQPSAGILLYYQIAARVQKMSDEIKDTRGIRAFTGNYVVVIDRPIAVSLEDRVNWVDAGGIQRYLDIKGSHDADRIDELPKLDCWLEP